MKMLTDRYILILLMFALLVVTVISHRSAIDGSSFLTRSETSVQLDDGTTQLAETCQFIEVKGPAGVRAMKCLLPPPASSLSERNDLDRSHRQNLGDSL